MLNYKVMMEYYYDILHVINLSDVSSSYSYMQYVFLDQDSW